MKDLNYNSAKEPEHAQYMNKASSNVYFHYQDH